MLFRFYLWPNLFDPALRADKEGDPMRAHVFAAHETLLTPNSVCLDNLFVLIRQKRKWQFEFCDEFIVRLDGIGADAEHHSAFLFKLRELIAKCASLLCAAGRIVLWIKIKNDVLAAEIRE